MSLTQVPAGRDLPNDVNVIIEIPAFSDPVKYEVDKQSGALIVDRFLGTAMQYPANYGYIPQTLSDDGDPVDVLVITPAPLIHGCVIRCRPIGVLKMTDEAGGDAKVLAAPVDKLTPLYKKIHDYQAIEPSLLAQIAHFFSHYKDLEEGKWVKIEGWFGIDEARREIMESFARHHPQP